MPHLQIEYKSRLKIWTKLECQRPHAYINELKFLLGQKNQKQSVQKSIENRKTEVSMK